MSFLQNLLKFIITIYLEKESDAILSVGVDEHPPSGLSVTGDKKDLSMSCDQKVMTLLPPMEKFPITFYHRVAFTAQIW